MKARIAIVHPWTNLDSIPCVCNAAELLARAGYGVDIFTRIDSRHMLPSFGESIHMIAQLPRRERGGIKSFIPSRLSQTLQVLNRHRREPYRCFIGVDPRGLLEAHALSRFIRVPLVYFSLELLLFEELSGGRQIKLKRKEKALSRKAAFIIIQDRERAKLLADDNDIPLDRFALVPNAPLGPASSEQSDYWHQRFNLPSGCRIVFHAGSLGPWTAIEEIVASVSSWPENWVLVVHTRFDSESSEEIDRMRERAPEGRVFFSLTPVARQEYDKLVAGADIGIAFYVPVSGSTFTQQNIEVIGLSSGKIAYYLRAGLPVIVNETASIGELVPNERCGVSVRGAEDIGRAIAEIAQDYEGYSKRACQAFEGHFDFAHSFEEVVSRLDSL